VTPKTPELPVIAIFDLDYTLTKRGTWGRFVWRTVRGRPHLWIPLLFSTAMFQWQYKRGKLPRGAVKKTMMRWSLQRFDKTRLTEMAQEFARREVDVGLRTGGKAALKYHTDQGHRIILASAAVDLVVGPIARELGISDYVSTELDWSETGRLKSDFKSPNCYGEEKLGRVKKLMARIAPCGAHTYFYSDSKADLPVLDYVNVPIVVDPSKKFNEYATSREFDIQYWLKGDKGFSPVHPEIKKSPL